MVVAPRARKMERRARGPREGLEGMLDELERQPADPLAAERQIDHRVRPATDVDDGPGQRLVHRDRRLAEPADPGTVAERLREGSPEHERHVLDGVVLVDIEVARGTRPRGRTGRGARATSGGGRRSRSRSRSMRRPEPSRSSVMSISVSRVRRASVTRRAGLGRGRSTLPSGVVIGRPPFRAG